MSHPSEEPTFEDFRERADAMRQDFIAVADRHMATAGQQFPANLVAYILIELGVRLSMTVQDPRKGADLARQHVEAIIALSQSELQGGANH